VSHPGPGEGPGTVADRARRELGKVAAALGDSLGDRVGHQRPLGGLTTYRVGGAAALFVEAVSEADLLAVRRALRGRKVPLLVVGRGSNLLVADSGFDGVVVRLGGRFAEITIPGGAVVPEGQPVVVRAGGGAGLPVLARRTVEAGLSGFEWAVGVPGSVGGAVRMNAGGHGGDMASCLVRYRWLDLVGDGGGEDSPERLGLGYRTSTLSSGEVVVWAEVGLRTGPVDAGRRALSEIVRWRRRHQPGGSNAGSVFVNPPGDSAGRLVERAGLKGFRLGSAQVSTKHANFIQADDGGSADDVYRLIEHVRRVVAERCGITLRTEVHLVGFPAAENGGDATGSDGGTAGTGTAVTGGGA